MHYNIGDIIEMKKQHPCKKSKEWKIVRVGVDIKIECLGCHNIIMLQRPDFEKKLKRIIKTSTID